MASLSDGVESMVRLLQGRHGNGDKVTIETIESVNGNGTYAVRGIACPTTGTAQLKVGDRVAVAWRGAKPYLIFAHQARRAQFGPYVSAGGGVLEELIEAPPTATSGADRDIWFRNDSQVTLLNLRALLGLDSVHLAGAWGWDKRHFLVRNSANTVVYVIKLEGETTKPIGSATPEVSLVAAYTPAELTTNLGTIAGFFGASFLLVGLATTQNYTEPLLLNELMVSGGRTLYLHLHTGENPARNYSHHTYEGATDYGSGASVLTESAQFGGAYLNEANEPVGVFRVSLSFLVNGSLSSSNMAYSVPVVINLATGAVLYNGVVSYADFPAAGPVRDPLNISHVISLTIPAWSIQTSFTPIISDSGAWAKSFCFAFSQDSMSFGTNVPHNTIVTMFPAGAVAEVIVASHPNTISPVLPTSGFVTEQYFFYSSSSRHMLWQEIYIPDGDFQHMEGRAIHVTDCLEGVDGVIAAADPVALSFLKSEPTMLSPRSMLALNAKPGENLKSDEAPFFVDFLTARRSDGKVLQIHAPGVPPKTLAGTEALSLMAPFTEDSAHIPAYRAAQLAYSPGERASVFPQIYASAINLVRYQIILRDDVGFEFIEN